MPQVLDFGVQQLANEACVVLEVICLSSHVLRVFGGESHHQEQTSPPRTSLNADYY